MYLLENVIRPKKNESLRHAEVWTSVVLSETRQIEKELIWEISLIQNGSTHKRDAGEG